MPIKPEPLTYRCAQCGWSTIIRPRSDALMPGDCPMACPECGHQPLQAQPALHARWPRWPWFRRRPGET